MRLATLRHAGAWRTAIVHPARGTAFVLPADVGTIDDIVRNPRLAERARELSEAGPEVDLDLAVLGPPVRRFNRDVLCTGWNYWDHYEESMGKREGQDPAAAPLHPTFFTKGPDTVIGPFDDIAFDARISDKWDYEAEVALIIGRAGRSIREEDAMSHVFGFCIANDVSHRDLQRAHGGQWLKGKSIDLTMPLGPWLTTADDVGDPYQLTIQCEVNGRQLQNASTAQMAFSFERIIAELSWGMMLRAGDVILTGTPAGIGNARDPQVFLDEGDQIVTRVSGLGELRNLMVAADLSSPSAEMDESGQEFG